MGKDQDQNLLQSSSSKREPYRLVSSGGEVVATVDSALPPQEQAEQVLDSLFKGMRDKDVEEALRKTVPLGPALDRPALLEGLQQIIRTTMKIVGTDNMIAAIKSRYPSIWQSMQDPSLNASSGSEIIAESSSDVTSFAIKAPVDINFQEGRVTYRIKDIGMVEIFKKSPPNSVKRFSVESEDFVMIIGNAALGNQHIVLVRQKKAQILPPPVKQIEVPS